MRQLSEVFPSGRPRVLLTGVRGFTGAPMRHELEGAGYEVIGTALSAADGELNLDIDSREACVSVIRDACPDYVIHLAGISLIPHTDPVELYRANVVGAMNVLESLAASGLSLKKVIVASSANIYGNKGGLLITETQEAAPTNHYAAAKFAMEKLAETLFDRLPLIITRPFNYTGVGQSTDFLVPKIVAHFARRAAYIELGNMDVARDFSDVRMVANVYRRLMESDARSKTFNICTGVATSLRSVISMMEDIAGYHIEVRVNPAFVRSNDIKHLTGDPRALIEAIGPLHIIPFRETLEGMYQAMRP